MRGILSAFHGRPHIFNLGHGILPQTPCIMSRQRFCFAVAPAYEQCLSLDQVLHILAVISWMAGMLSAAPFLFIMPGTAKEISASADLRRDGTKAYAGDHVACHA
jgi:hypothetical protein